MRKDLNHLFGYQKRNSLDNRMVDMTGCTATIPTEEYCRLVLNNEKAEIMLEDLQIKFEKIHDKAVMDFINYVEQRLFINNIEKIKDFSEIEQLRPEEMLDKYCYSDLDSIGDLQEMSQSKYFGIIELDEMIDRIKTAIYRKLNEFKNKCEEHKDGTNEE
jgi:hypothetical protein